MRPALPVTSVGMAGMARMLLDCQSFAESPIEFLADGFGDPGTEGDAEFFEALQTLRLQNGQRPGVSDLRGVEVQVVQTGEGGAARGVLAPPSRMGLPARLNVF